MKRVAGGRYTPPKRSRVDPLEVFFVMVGVLGLATAVAFVGTVLWAIVRLVSYFTGG